MAAVAVLYRQMRAATPPIQAVRIHLNGRQLRASEISLINGSQARERERALVFRRLDREDQDVQRQVLAGQQTSPKFTNRVIALPLDIAMMENLSPVVRELPAYVLLAWVVEIQYVV